MDNEIQETVEAILGKNVKVIDCEKKSSIKEEEVLLVNGCPVTLDGEDGVAIKDALLRGNIPNCHSLNQILVRVGILKAPVKLETNLSVKSNVVTREEVTVAKGGQIVDERSRETKEDNFYTSNTSEIWEPVGIMNKNDLVVDSVPRKSSSSTTRNVCSSNASFDEGTSSKTSTSFASPPNFQETKMTSVSKVCSSDAPDETDFVYSKRKVTRDTPNELPIHVLPLDSTLAKERIDNDLNLVYRDEKLYSGKLEALIQHSVPTVDYYPEKKFLFAFILTSRLFIKPHELLGRIIQICDARYDFNDKSPLNKERLTSITPRIVRFMGDWIEWFPYDFRDDRIMSHVRSITQKCINANPEMLPEVQKLLRNLLSCLTNLEHYEEFLQEINQNSVKHSVDVLSPGNITELCPDPKILAQQLCHIELERLSYIGPEEFVQTFVHDKNRNESLKEVKKTRNLESYVQWFNRLSHLVGSEICKHPKKKVRVKIIEYWIEVARESFNIGNFNSLMAIIAGLNLSSVTRLKKTWAKVQSAKFSVLEHQMNPTSNFSSYRSTLKAAMWRSAGNNMQQQCLVIPFFSLLMKDMYFLNEGCANKLPNNHINFEKFWHLARQISDFMDWKKTVCPFSKDLHLITFLQASPVLSEKALSMASFECEPPENTQEKEQFRTLKATEV